MKGLSPAANRKDYRMPPLDWRVVSMVAFRAFAGFNQAGVVLRTWKIVDAGAFLKTRRTGPANKIFYSRFQCISFAHQRASSFL